MKSVMILGAGPYQVPAIQTVKELGYKAIVLDYDKKASGVALADEFYEISTIDKDRVLKKAEELRPNFIITSTSDLPVRTVAYVAEKLNLEKDLSYANSICATDKSAMRERLKKSGVPIPNFFSCRNFDEFTDAIRKFSNYCIVKPADNAASRGVKLIDKNLTKSELEEQYNFTKHYSRNGVVMVEEFMTGPEVSVECFIVNGKPNVIAITDKLVTSLPYFVELGHSEPSQLPEDVQNGIRNIAILAIKAIGIQNGVSHVELKITPNGPKIVEIAARLGGDYITAKLVPLSTGVDMVKNSIFLALRRPFDIEKTLNCGSAIRFITAPKGVVKEIKIEKNPLEIEGVKDFQLNVKVGDSVADVKSSNDRIGFVITQAKTAKEAIEIAERALSYVRIDVDFNFGKGGLIRQPIVRRELA